MPRQIAHYTMLAICLHSWHYFSMLSVFVTILNIPVLLQMFGETSKGYIDTVDDLLYL